MCGPAVHTDTAEPRHDPSAALGRLVDLRDQHFSAPGCAARANPAPGGRRPHRDHIIPYPQGPTAAWNLELKSERCHRAKHTGWTVTRHDGGGHTWTSPLGRAYWRPSSWAPPPVLPEFLELPDPSHREHDDHDSGYVATPDSPLLSPPIEDAPSDPQQPAGWDDEPL